MQWQICDVPFYEWSYPPKKALDVSMEKRKDKGVGDCISISSPDDLFKHGNDDIDLIK